MKHRLTQTQIYKRIPYLVERDGKICLYCEKELDPTDTAHTVVEHLNDNPFDNRIENQILSHHACNDRKKFSKEYQKKATNKLEENEFATTHLVDNKQLAKIFNRLEDNSENNASTEIEINVKNYDITEKYISERVTADDSIEYKDALNSCAELCKKTTGHGAQQTIRNYIDMLTSSVGRFMIIRDEKTRKKLIVRRENLT